MAALIKLVPNEKTLYYVTQSGQYRCHNGVSPGMLTSDVERALLHPEYQFIDCFPTFGGDCTVSLKREGDIWIELEGE